jgi:hypothetical protein
LAFTRHSPDTDGHVAAGGDTVAALVYLCESIAVGIADSGRKR